MALGATAIIGTTIEIIRHTLPLRNATAIARAMTESKTILAALGTMPGIYFGNMNDKIKQLLDTAEKVDGISKIKWRIQNRDLLRKQRKIELKRLMENDQQNSIDWLIEKFSRVLAKTDFTDEQNFYMIKYIEQAREMYQDEIEALIIKQCAEESTSEAHKKEIHRQQIIAAYKAAMHTQYLESHTLTRYGYIHKAEQYYNETYNK